MFSLNFTQHSKFIKFGVDQIWHTWAPSQKKNKNMLNCREKRPWATRDFCLPRKKIRLNWELKKACDYNKTKRSEEDLKISVPLAILMSNAVRIRAIRVELKWTVLSSATGRSIRSNLCEKASWGEQWESWEVGSVFVEPPGDNGVGGGEGFLAGRGTGWETGLRPEELCMTLNDRHGCCLSAGKNSAL